MTFLKNAEVAVKDILTAFETPDQLPTPLAQVFIHRHDNVPCRKWSWRNQLILDTAEDLKAAEVEAVAVA